jgi:hypothetical protein
MANKKVLLLRPTAVPGPPLMVYSHNIDCTIRDQQGPRTTTKGACEMVQSREVIQAWGVSCNLGANEPPRNTHANQID